MYKKSNKPVILQWINTIYCIVNSNQRYCFKKCSVSRLSLNRGSTCIFIQCLITFYSHNESDVAIRNHVCSSIIYHRFAIRLVAWKACKALWIFLGKICLEEKHATVYCRFITSVTVFIYNSLTDTSYIYIEKFSIFVLRTSFIQKCLPNEVHEVHVVSNARLPFKYQHSDKTHQLFTLNFRAKYQF